MKKEFTYPNGDKITIEPIVGFAVKELEKKFIAFAVNDDGVSEKVEIGFLEKISETEVNGVLKDEIPIVLNAYRTVRSNLLEK